jgi:hypothetical protein
LTVAAAVPAWLWNRDVVTEPSNPELSDAQRSTFMTALTTEHFVLQTAASTTVTEATARASAYLMTLSSSLVAIGFTSGTQAFVPLVSTLIPLVTVLGIFAIVRLVDTGVENLAMQTKIAHIRSFCRTLSPDAPSYFPDNTTHAANETPAAIVAKPSPSTKRTRRPWMGTKGLFTMASMIAVPNSIVAGAGVTLGTARLLSEPVGFVVGSIVVVVALGTFWWYQNRRYQASA